MCILENSRKKLKVTTFAGRMDFLQTITNRLSTQQSLSLTAPGGLRVKRAPTTPNSQTSQLLSMGIWGLSHHPSSYRNCTSSPVCPDKLGGPDWGQPYVPRVWPSRGAKKAQISQMGLNVSMRGSLGPKQGDQTPKPSLEGKSAVIIGKETLSERRRLGTSRGQPRKIAWSSMICAVAFCKRSSNNINDNR